MKTSILLKKILSALNDIEKLIIAGQFEDANEIGLSYFNEMKSQIPQFLRLRFFSALVSTSKLVLEDQIYYNMGKKKALKDIAETKKFFIQNMSDRALEEEQESVDQYIQNKIMRNAKRRIR